MHVFSQTDANMSQIKFGRTHKSLCEHSPGLDPGNTEMGP